MPATVMRHCSANGRFRDGDYLLGESGVGEDHHGGAVVLG